MSKVRLTGSTSGYTELAAPATAGNNTITLPSSNGSVNQLLKNGGTSGTLEWSSLTDDGAGNVTATTFTGNLSGNATTATTAASVSSALTFSNAGTGAASGTTYNGSVAQTISYNSMGAPSTGGAGASGTWGINITGNAGTVTNGVYLSTNNNTIWIGGTSNNPVLDNSANACAVNQGGFFSASRDSNPALLLNRKGTDGQIVQFYAQGSQEGNIQVNGSTTSYNAFMGGHWGRLVDNSRPEIPIGTVLEAVDQLVQWKCVKFSVDDGEKIMPYYGSSELGETVSIEYEGSIYSGIVQQEGESNSDINKHVCVKVSDTVRSAAVYGVFFNWDDEPIGNMVCGWNDLTCAAIGNFFVRMAEGETPEVGSLLQSGGNGCAIVQDDDIIRSSTIGKVTSTIAQRTYDDGSFLITCVLYCG